MTTECSINTYRGLRMPGLGAQLTPPKKKFGGEVRNCLWGYVGQVSK